MNNDFYIGPIVLSERDSVNFVNELRNPSADYILRRDKAFSIADSEMTITDCENGFVVDIPDLDISAIMERKSSPVLDEVAIDYDGIVAALSHVACASEMLVKSALVSSGVLGCNHNTWNTNGISTECEISIAGNNDREKLVEGNATNLRFAA